MPKCSSATRRRRRKAERKGMDGKKVNQVKKGMNGKFNEQKKKFEMSVIVAEVTTATTSSSRTTDGEGNGVHGNNNISGIRIPKRDTSQTRLNKYQQDSRMLKVFSQSNPQTLSGSVV